MSSANDSDSVSSAAPSEAIRAELIQGSPEWYAARCGKITASCFGKLGGSGRSGGGWTQTAITYMTQVMGERITGVPQDEIQSKYLDHGNRHEPTARQLYQWYTKSRVELKQVGFLDHPELQFCGGSPDALIDDDGVLEIKCPYTIHGHIANIESDGTSDRDYTWQMQGNLWITGRKWCDFVSFHPYVPSSLQFHVVRYMRDEDVIEEIAARVPRALEQIAIRVKNIEERVRQSV